MRAAPLSLALGIALASCGGDPAAFHARARAVLEVEQAADAACARALEEAATSGTGPLASLRGMLALEGSWRSELRLSGVEFDGTVPRRVAGDLEARMELSGGSRRVVRSPVGGTVSGTAGGYAVALEPASLVPVRLDAPRPAFRDETAEAGLADVHQVPDIDVRNRLVLGIWPGSGAGAADVDGDGDVDLLALDGRRSLLYENDGHARFRDATDARGLAGLAGSGCAFADLDDDGDPDLLVTNAFGGNRLFENEGGRFRDRTETSGVKSSPKGSSAVAADYDGDGRLDLYVCNSGDYYRVLPEPVWNARDGHPNRLFRNLGDFRFEERAPEAGVDTRGWSLAASFTDEDGDGDQDLYVANDFGLNQLFRNRGDGTFDDVTEDAGAGDRGYGMSATWGDYDEDGDEDLYVSNIETHYAFLMADADFPLPPGSRLVRRFVVPLMQGMVKGNSLLRRGADGRYADVSLELGVNRGGWSWSAIFLDYDLDGLLDLFGPNGFVSQEDRTESELAFWIDSTERWHQYLTGEAVFDMEGRSLQGHERDVLFRGSGGGPFTEVGYLEGADPEGDARGAVRADFDGDGRPDLYVRQVKAAGALLMNRTGARGRVALRLQRPSGGPAVGARVVATVGARKLHRRVAPHEGYFASQDPTIFLGLGEAGAADALEVTWPSGRSERHGPVPAGSLVTWREGAPPEIAELAP